MTETSDRYRRLAAEFTRRVEAVPAQRWDDQSPCPDWTARGVLRHVIETERDVPKWAGQDPLPLEESVDDDPLGAWTEIRDQLQELLDDPERAGAAYDGQFGRRTIEQTVDSFIAFDLLVHGWDIARATGQDETLPTDEVSRAHAFAEELGDNLRRDGVCGPAVDVPESASDQDRLLGLVGRTP